MILTKQVREEIKACKGHYKIELVAEHYGVQLATVRKLQAGEPKLKDLDEVPYVPSPLRGDELDIEILHFYQFFNYDTRRISEKLDVPERTVYKHWLKLGLPRKKELAA